MKLEKAGFPDRWRIQSARLQIETFSSRIWDVMLDSGVRAIVKALKPFDDMADELRGAHYLAWRGGVGAVRLIDIDGSNMLLEHGGERLLEDELLARGDVYSTEVMAEVLQRMFSPSDTPIPPEFQPLQERFCALFEKANRERQESRAGPYVEAAAIAERLLAHPHDLRPLHGDLHHGNVIHGSRGWLVIDPKGVYGDPAFEAANVFYNPLDRDDLCLEPDRIARLADVFSRVLEQSPQRLLSYAIAYGALSAAWHAQDENDEDEQRELAVAAAIGDVLHRM